MNKKEARKQIREAGYKPLSNWNEARVVQTSKWCSGDKSVSFEGYLEKFPKIKVNVSIGHKQPDIFNAAWNEFYKSVPGSVFDVKNDAFFGFDEEVGNDWLELNTNTITFTKKVVDVGYTAPKIIDQALLKSLDEVHIVQTSAYWTKNKGFGNNVEAYGCGFKGYIEGYPDGEVYVEINHDAWMDDFEALKDAQPGSVFVIKNDAKDKYWRFGERVMLTPAGNVYSVETQTINAKRLLTKTGAQGSVKLSDCVKVYQNNERNVVLTTRENYDDEFVKAGLINFGFSGDETMFVMTKGQVQSDLTCHILTSEQRNLKIYDWDNSIYCTDALRALCNTIQKCIEEEFDITLFKD